MFDVAKVPFSRWGSYFSVSINSWGPLGEGLYLRTHYDNSPQVFKIDLVRGDKVVGYEVEALPSILRLWAEGGGIHAPAKHRKSFCGSEICVRLRRLARRKK